MTQVTRNRIRLFFFLLLAGLFLSLSGTEYAYAERPHKTCSPKEVHPIWWKAKMTRSVKTRVIGSRKKVRLKQGLQVTLISNNRKGRKKIMLKNGMCCYVPNGSVLAYEDACTKGDYSRKTKLAFVNSRTIRSKTKYMIWVSTDMQSLNVFVGSNRKWRLIKVYKCSTGMAGYETPIGRFIIQFKTLVQHSDQWDSNLYYFLCFNGSGIHKWPGPNASKGLGKHPCSHQCIRLATDPARWMFKHIPENTRLLIY